MLKQIAGIAAIVVAAIVGFCLCDGVAYGPPDNDPCASTSTTIKWYDSCAWMVSDACIGEWKEKEVGERAGMLGGHFHSLKPLSNGRWKLTYWHPITRSSSRVIPSCKKKS